MAGLHADNDLRQNVTDVLLDRLHHDQPVHGQYGSVQRTTRRNRSLKDDEEVLAPLEDAGIDRERVLSVDRNKVDDALDVTEPSESDVYDIEETEYVRKAEVDEEKRETRLQGLKDRLATSDDPESNELRAEIEELENRIEELTEFNSGRSFHTSSETDSNLRRLLSPWYHWVFASYASRSYWSLRPVTRSKHLLSVNNARFDIPARHLSVLWSGDPQERGDPRIRGRRGHQTVCRMSRV